MASCGTCGRPIEWLEVSGERKAFDPHPVISGEGRYMEFVGELRHVRPTSTVMAQQLHEQTCGKGHFQ